MLKLHNFHAGRKIEATKSGAKLCIIKKNFGHHTFEMCSSKISSKSQAGRDFRPIFALPGTEELLNRHPCTRSWSEAVIHRGSEGPPENKQENQFRSLVEKQFFKRIQFFFYCEGFLINTTVFCVRLVKCALLCCIQFCRSSLGLKQQYILFYKLYKT